ncbi:MAG: TetR/AcrR family transcriptional regulator, partial [Pseudomonadales bacterium]|nr:TetR/AcrR family transcriptional regulator [Pseudomonadales bacterium]
MSQNSNTNASNETRRRQILDAAITVLLKKGFSSSSMNDFIRASGLSKGGVYHHFKSKEDLLMGVVNRYFEEYLAEVTAIDLSNETAYQQLKYFLTGHQDSLLKMGNLSQLLMDFYAQAAHIPRIRDQFR